MYNTAYTYREHKREGTTIMDRLKSIVLVAAATILAASFALPQTASAEGSAALSITPKKTYTIERGKSVNDTLTIRNLDFERPLTLNLRVIDFTFTDDGGTPKLMLDEDAPQTTWSLKPYLTVPKTVTIDPGASQTLDMSVAIPANRGAGSLYSAIVYSSSSSEGGNVGLSASGVTLVFTSIPGDVKENLLLKKIGAYDDKAGKFSYFNNEQPHRVAYTLKNEGNVVEAPVGSITLKNIFGHEVTINNINPSSSLALIDQERTFQACIKLASEKVDFNGSRTEATTCADPGLWPGYYSVSLNAFYGQNGNATKDLIGNGGFWYLPWWFVAIVLALLVFVGYHVWRVVRFVRKRRGGTSFKKRSTRR